MTEFTELYKKLSHFELLKIITESEKYQPVAVETAKTEIENRQLTVKEINEAKARIIEQEKERLGEIEKRYQRKEKVIKNTSILFDTINPIHNGTQTPEKIIRLTILIFGVLAVYELIQEYGMIEFMFSDPGAEWDLSMLEYFFPLLLLPIALTLFWKRKNWGWILLAVFLTYSAVTAVVLFLMNFGRQPSEFPALEALFPTISPITYILTFIFYGGFLLLICRRGVRNIYGISKLTVQKTIATTTIINLLLIYSILN